MELWKTKIPSKIAVFAWRLCRGRLPIKENLHKRHMQINNMLCPFYSGAIIVADDEIVMDANEEPDGLLIVRY